MSENSATRVLEEGQNRAFADGRIRASAPRPLLAAHDGGFTEVPGTGYGPAAELGTAFHRIMDRGVPRHTQVRPVREESARHERPSARPGQGGRTTRAEDVSQSLHALAAPAANTKRVLEAVAGAGLTRRADPHDRIRRLRGARLRRARLRGAPLSGARLHGAPLSGARLSGVARDYQADDLPSPVRHTARVATAVAQLAARDGSLPGPVAPGPSTTGEAAVPPATE
ncbi:pentapeptide repeat-containing protein [Streptomyces sp. NBC_01176]|uniref:pentapeptide repeat-containing protein n=1 Tax=Streptomyces sp. NBC_01176 TaxID=2903760 RepID=UPI00386D7BF7|nr:pentapeptide repeat-containing protein [Streptomyces sp. NBC_01176]